MSVFPFFLNLFLVFSGAFENYWKFQKMTSSMHQLDSFFHRKPPPYYEHFKGMNSELYSNSVLVLLIVSQFIFLSVCRNPENVQIKIQH
ncbi:Uncharacterized protein FWK35_00005758 [Aphis craccivora]|uniref:Uncharacterized protein n=1 Tax=Aphis craccivora TaxID=307492 RepID=A0A6G0ZB91_APHCR|nr:Uncharacterized protein FWK35_00005758 [Aphis craccivora]